MRKSKKIQQEEVEAKKRLDEIARLREEAEKEELSILQLAENSVKEICNRDNLFAGAVLGVDDILAVVKLAIISGETQIKIPVKFYFNDNA